MTVQTAFVVQPFTFEGRKRRRLVPLPKREVQSEQHALHQAEYLATRRAGAAALALTVATASGERSRLGACGRTATTPTRRTRLLAATSSRASGARTTA